MLPPTLATLTELAAFGSVARSSPPHARSVPDARHPDRRGALYLELPEELNGVDPGGRL